MLSQILAVGALASFASASLFMTAPVATTVCTGGQPCPIKWMNNGDTAPAALTAYGPMTAGVYVGNVNQQTLVLDLGNLDPAKTATLPATIPVGAGPNGDFYFIRFQQVNPTNGTTLQAFSAKFTLKGMTGQLSPAASAQIAGVTSAAAASSATSPSSAAGASATSASSGTSRSGLASVTSASSAASSSASSARASASGSTSGASSAGVAKGFTAVVALAGAMSFFV